MRMWATCRSTNKAAGFTLLEILVVLAIAGLLVSVTLPQMSGMAERVRIVGERQAILAAIEGLGYRAYSSGLSLTIQAPTPTTSSEKTSLPFTLPVGWSLSTRKTIHYAVNGTCSGGDITLISPDHRTEHYKLAPPLCRTAPVAEG